MHLGWRRALRGIAFQAVGMPVDARCIRGADLLLLVHLVGAGVLDTVVG